MLMNFSILFISPASLSVICSLPLLSLSTPLMNARYWEKDQERYRKRKSEQKVLKALSQARQPPGEITLRQSCVSKGLRSKECNLAPVCATQKWLFAGVIGCSFEYPCRCFRCRPQQRHTEGFLALNLAINTPRLKVCVSVYTHSHISVAVPVQQTKNKYRMDEKVIIKWLLWNEE